MATLLFRLLLLVLLAAGALPAYADQPDEMALCCSVPAYNDLNNEAFEKIDQRASEWEKGLPEISDGRAKLSGLFLALDSFSHGPDFNVTYRKLQHWKARYPASRIQPIAEAMYWDSYAWQARGRGFADTVTPERWKLFFERLKKAEAVLLAAKPRSASSPLWYRAYLDIARGLQWSPDQQFHLLDEALARQKYWFGTYDEIVISLLPKWGGSYEAVDQFADHAVDLTRDRFDTIAYEAMYQEVMLCGCTQNIFANTKVSWSKMKRSFDDLMKHHPGNKRNMNIYAHAACQAGDKEMYKKYEALIGNDVMDSLWDQTYSLQNCDAWFATPNRPPGPNVPVHLTPVR